MLGWHACADRLLRGAIPIAPLRSLPSSLFTHGRWVHAVNILIITEDDLSQKMPCIHRANLLIISGHFHFCLTEAFYQDRRFYRFPSTRVTSMLW